MLLDDKRENPRIFRSIEQMITACLTHEGDALPGPHIVGDEPENLSIMHVLQDVHRERARPRTGKTSGIKCFIDRYHGLQRVLFIKPYRYRTSGFDAVKTGGDVPI